VSVGDSGGRFQDFDSADTTYNLGKAPGRFGLRAGYQPRGKGRYKKTLRADSGGKRENDTIFVQCKLEVSSYSKIRGEILDRGVGTSATSMAGKNDELNA